MKHRIQGTLYCYENKPMRSTSLRADSRRLLNSIHWFVDLVSTETHCSVLNILQD